MKTFFVALLALTVSGAYAQLPNVENTIATLYCANDGCFKDIMHNDGYIRARIDTLPKAIAYTYAHAPGDVLNDTSNNNTVVFTSYKSTKKKSVEYRTTQQANFDATVASLAASGYVIKKTGKNGVTLYRSQQHYMVRVNTYTKPAPGGGNVYCIHFSEIKKWNP